MVTDGMFYCRDNVEMNGSGSLQPSARFESEVLRFAAAIGNKNIPSNHWVRQTEKKR